MEVVSKDTLQDCLLLLLVETFELLFESNLVVIEIFDLRSLGRFKLYNCIPLSIELVFYTDVENVSSHQGVTER